MPNRPQFDAHIEDLLRQAAPLAEGWVADTLDALRDPAGSGLASQDRRLLGDLYTTLEAQRSVIAELLTGHLRAGITGAQARALGHAGTAAALSGFDIDELSLVDESQAEKDIEISRIVQLLDLNAEWQLRELQGFAINMLPDVPEREDPSACGPAVFARAISQTAYALPMAEPVRSLWLRIAGRCFASRLTAFYSRTSERLRAAGVSAPRYRAILTPSGSGGAAGAAGAAAAAGPAASAPAAPNLPPEVLAQLLQRLPLLQSGLPAAAPVARPRDGVDSTLAAELASFRLEPMAGDGDVAASRLPPRTIDADAGADAATTALLGRLFARLLDDPQLSGALRGSLGRLQAPLQQLARQDPGLLTSEQHPAWALINQLAAHAGELPAQDAARGEDFQRFVEPLIDRLASAPAQPAAFEQALGDVQRFVEQDRVERVERTRPMLDALGQAEEAKRLLPLLRPQVELQLDRAEAVSPVLRTFLLGPWVEALAQAMVSQGADAPQTQALVGTVDDLLASLQRPATEAERVALRKRLPDLVTRLQQGMDLIDLPGPHRERVMAHLMQAHRANLFERPPAAAPTAAPAATAAPMPAAPAAPTPSAAPRIELEDSLQDSLPAPASWEGSDTHIGGLPTVPMGLDDADEAETQLSAWLASLRPGMRFKLYLQGRWTTTKLAWRSDNGEFFMFTSNLAGGMHSLTLRGLKRLRSGGLATEVAEPSAVQRAVSGLLRELGGAPA